jgi:aminocarboxymuconate-semialdehyde decarboxylase
VHAHFYPERFLKSLADEGGPADARIEYLGPGRPVLIRGASRLELDATYWDLEQRVRRMTAQGVTVHALSLTTPMVHWAPPERGAQLARLVNEAMAEAHAAFPTRFVGLAALPVQDPALAMQELDRAAGLKAMRGIYLPTHVGARELSDPAFFPIYERCEALDLPVLLHPTSVIGADRLGRANDLGNLLGTPFDGTVASASLVFGGVLDRYPKLNVVLPHAGGALPYLWGRLQHAQEVRPEMRNAAQKPFREYLRRFHYDTLGHAPETVRFLVGLVGPDRVLMGSDYCFDLGYEKPRDIVTKLGLKPADQDKVFSGNAARLFKL